ADAAPLMSEGRRTTRRLGIAIACLAAAACVGATARAGESPSMSRALQELRDLMGDLRGHPFVQAVPIDRLTRDGSRAFLLRKMRQEYPPEVVAAEQTTYRQFGLLSDDQELEPLFVDLMVERAAGFYDPDEKKLFLVEGQPWGSLALAHEMAHA